MVFIDQLIDYPINRTRLTRQVFCCVFSLCICGFTCDICVVLTCFSSLLLVPRPSGGPCFVTVAFLDIFTYIFSEALLMSIHSICFCGDIRNIFMWIFPVVILELSEREKFCENFRIFSEKFWSKFWTSLYILYTFPSPSAQSKEKSASLGRLFLPNRPLG